MASDTTTYTLRLKHDLKDRLEALANERNISLNQLFIELAENYYLLNGYVAQHEINSPDGEAYRIDCKPNLANPPDQPACDFEIFDLRRQRIVALYKIGLTRQLLDTFRVRQPDQYKAIDDIGTALIHYYNTGRDIKTLAWDQFPTDAHRRILSMKDIQHTNILRLSGFLRSLQAQDDSRWRDKHLLFIMSMNVGIWSRNGALLGYWADSSVYDTTGEHIAQIKVKKGQRLMVFSLDGKCYFGDIFDNRLLMPKNPEVGLTMGTTNKRPARQAVDANLDAEAIEPLPEIDAFYRDEEIGFSK